MDVRQLRYFVHIVDYGSLGKAAEKLFVAQPSLSQQIAKLEDDLGVPLLVRSPQGVKPTAAGQALYRHARLVLHQMEQLRQEVRDGVGAESGTVAIGFPTTMTSVLAMPVFERVRERYPGIRLQFFESMSGYLNELLANGRLDLAILFRDTATPGISALPGRSPYPADRVAAGVAAYRAADREACGRARHEQHRVRARVGAQQPLREFGDCGAAHGGALGQLSGGARFQTGRRRRTLHRQPGAAGSRLDAGLYRSGLSSRRPQARLNTLRNARLNAHPCPPLSSDNAAHRSRDRARATTGGGSDRTRGSPEIPGTSL